MPWTATDAHKHTHKATPGKESRQWSDIANSVRQRGGSDASAIKQAIGVIAKRRYKRAGER